MSRTLGRKDAIEFLRLDIKTFDNYFKSANEFRGTKSRGRYQFEYDKLKLWLHSYKWRTVKLSRGDYFKCLDFALAMYFRGYVPADWGKARRREFGQLIANWIRGQLAEIAVQKFLKRKFGVNVELDFELHKDIVPQDIVGVRKRIRSRKPRKRVAIKGSKPKSAYMVVGKNEVEKRDRMSDIYIFCRPDLADDHLLRLARGRISRDLKNKHHWSKYSNKIESIQEAISCELAGWCKIGELKKVKKIPGQDFDGERYVMATGDLRRSKKQWEKLVNLL